MNVHEALANLQNMLTDPDWRANGTLVSTEALDQLHVVENWAEVFNADIVDTDWLIEPFIARGRGHALYAGAKTGKSLLVLELSAAAATGRNQPAIHVLYLDYEMTLSDLRERLEGFGYGPQDDLSNLHYALLPSIPPLDTSAGGNLIVEAATHYGAELVVIDTTARAVTGNENDADTYRALYRHTGQLLKAAGIAYIRLDHAGKDLAQGQRGSSGKNDDVDVVWQMTKRDQGFRLTATHRRMSWVPAEFDLTLEEDELTGTITHRVLDRHIEPEGVRRVNALLDTLGAPYDVSKREARQLLKKADEKCTESVLVAALRKRKEMLVPPDGDFFAALLGTKRTANQESPGQNPVPSVVPESTGTESSGTGVYVPKERTAVPDQADPPPKRQHRTLY